jgi:hypothetical protein
MAQAKTCAQDVQLKCAAALTWCAPLNRVDHSNGFQSREPCGEISSPAAARSGDGDLPGEACIS